MKSSLNIPAHWTFKSASIATHFDKHVRDSLPWYDLATNAVAHLGRHYIPRGGCVYDIGASTGNIGRALADTIKHTGARFFAIEESAEMASKYVGPPQVVVTEATKHEYERFDFAVCFLVLMFLPVSERITFTRRLTSLLKPGGALVIVDKFQTPPGYLGTVFSRLTTQQKLLAGVSPDDIVRKEISLAGYQRPMNPATLPPGSERFFQVGEFSGWITVASETENGQQPPP